MKNFQDIQSTADLKSSAQGTTNEVQSQQPNPVSSDAPAGDSGSLSTVNNDNKKVSREDIELVQNLIERCLQLYMNKGEVVRTLSTRARIEPGFTTLVTNFPMGYPVLQQPIMPAPGQPHMDPMACGLSIGHVANGIPASGGYHPIRMNSGNDMAVDSGAPEAPNACATAMSSEMAVSPSSAASSNHAPFTPSEIPGMALDASALDSAFGSDIGNAGPLQLGPDGSSRDSIRSLGQLWNFSLSDLTADLTSLGDLEAFENYSGTPFLPSDSDILLDSPDHDDIVEYFADAINGSQSDEEKS